MDTRIFEMIEKRMRECEVQYQIKVLLWSFRGSIDIGIYRKNSDLDLVFIYKNLGSTKISAIHDIIGYGFDFWGWDIEDVIKTVWTSNEIYYNNINKVIDNYYISKEHSRGGLGYFSGIYCSIGNENIGGDSFAINELIPIFSDVMEKRILINNILSGVKDMIDTIQSFGALNANQYLYGIWRILLSLHVYHGGLPGESNIDFLLQGQNEEDIIEEFDLLRKNYKDSLAKGTQRYRLLSLNKFMHDNYFKLEEKIISLLPENKDRYKESYILMNDLIKYVK